MNNFIKILLLAFVLTTAISCNNYDQEDNMFESAAKVTLPYNFKNDQAKKLSISAFDLRQNGYYDRAIVLYNQAINIEPNNPKLFFDLSECYARKDDMSNAILCLDTCISLDSLNPFFYSNRGLYYYKMYENKKAVIDLKRAISLNDSIYACYANLSLVYYVTDSLGKACEALNHAKALGLPMKYIRNQKELSQIEELCK